MAKKKIRVALIGCGGNMRGAHIPPIKEDGSVELSAVTDTTEEQAKLLMDKWGGPVPFYSDYRKMIREHELDAILISSPHALHYEQAKYALDHDLHVLVEKPLTVSSNHTRRLIRLAETKNRVLLVSYQRNFYAPHTFVRELIQNGEIGDIRGVVAYVTQNWTGVGGWRLVPELSGGGMFFDTGSHLVASTLWMTGLESLEVSAFLDKTGKPVDINMVVNVRFKGGALGTLNTFGNASRHDERIAIHGSKGGIVFHLHQWEIKSVLLNDVPTKLPARIKEERPDTAFFRMIRHGGKGYELPYFALAVAQVSEAAYASVESGAPVKVKS
ncbi:MAG: Gfo/Idh/MocA family oxidoreductase [candidate division Zixibacteria bacterium]|nr:Gfo/Idh/MocA family oxidoreductase [candidate division Zixibacteria bacterium]